MARLEENKRYVVVKSYRDADMGNLKPGDMFLIREWNLRDRPGDVLFMLNDFTMSRPQEKLIKLLKDGIIAPEVVSPAPRGKRKTIQVGNDNIEVKAIAYGPWAIHKSLGGGGWTITFVPSGHMLASYVRTQKMAKKLLEEAAKAVPGLFTFRDLRQLNPHLNTLLPVVRQYRGASERVASERVAARYVARKEPGSELARALRGLRGVESAEVNDWSKVSSNPDVYSVNILVHAQLPHLRDLRPGQLKPGKLTQVLQGAVRKALQKFPHITLDSIVSPRQNWRPPRTKEGESPLALLHRFYTNYPWTVNVTVGRGW